MAGVANSGISVPSGKLFTPDLKPRLGVIGLILLLWVLWGGIMYAAADFDGVRYLGGDGRGLLEHYGYHACFLTGPLVLINGYYAVSYFLRMAKRIDQFVTPGAKADDVAGIVKPHIESVLLLGGLARWMLPLFCIIGMSIAFVQFSYLDHPELYWGNDVFNAEGNSASWWAANSYLLILWGVIYPIGLFYVLHIAISAQLIVEQLSWRQILRLNFLHADGCAGMGKFGTLNLILMMIYGWMAIAVWLLHMTHRNDYFALVAAAIGLSLLFVVHSFAGIFSVVKAVRLRREQAVEALNGRIRDLMDGTSRSFAGAVATMEYRDRVLAASAVPYAPGASAAVNILRYGPAAVGFAKLMLPLTVPI